MHTKGETVAKIMNVLEKEYGISELENHGMPTAAEIETRFPILAAAPKLLEASEIGLSYINAEATGVPRPTQDLAEDKRKLEAAIAQAKGGE
jgi:hypothetical protein